jgi:hypothetical protein
MVDDLEDKFVNEPTFVGSKLLLTKEQWLARQKQKKTDGNNSSSSGIEHRR